MSRNVTMTKDGTKLVITVDLSKSLGASKSGKSTIIGSTDGNAAIGDGVHVGLNVYRVNNQ